MDGLFIFPDAARQDPAVAAWLHARPGALGDMARRWFDVMRHSGGDVREVLHDGHPTACAGDAAFGYVNVFKTHVNVGFFCGAELPDPHGLLQGAGKRMRHVKLRPGHAVDESALTALITTACADMKARRPAA